MDEECIHLLTKSTCYLCSGHARRDEKQRALNKKRYMMLLARGVIKQQPRVVQHDDYIQRICRPALFENDNGSYNKRVR